MKQFDIKRLVAQIKSNTRTHGLVVLPNETLAKSWAACNKPEWMGVMTLDYIKKHIADELDLEHNCVITQDGLTVFPSCITPAILDFDGELSFTCSTQSLPNFWRAISAFLNMMNGANFTSSGLSHMYVNAQTYGEAFMHMIDSTGYDVVSAVDLIKQREPKIYKALNLKFKKYMNGSLSSVVRLSDSDRARSMAYARSTLLSTIDLVLNAGSVNDAAGVAELRNISQQAQSFIEIDSAISMVIAHESFTDPLVSEKLRLLRVTVQPDVEEQVKHRIAAGIMAEEETEEESGLDSLEDIGAVELEFEEQAEVEDEDEDIDEVDEDDDLELEDDDLEEEGAEESEDEDDDLELEDDDLEEDGDLENDEDSGIIGFTLVNSLALAEKFTANETAMKHYANDRLKINSTTYDWLSRQGLLPKLSDVDFEARGVKPSKGELLKVVFEIVEEHA